MEPWIPPERTRPRKFLTAPPSVSLTAISVADPSKSGAGTITITSSFSLAVTGPASVNAGATADLHGDAGSRRQLESEPRDFLERFRDRLHRRGLRDDFLQRRIHRAFASARRPQRCKSRRHRSPIPRRRLLFPWRSFRPSAFPSRQPRRPWRWAARRRFKPS